MEETMMNTALYPGCSLEGTSRSFDVSLNVVLKALGIELGTLKDWNCCGATSAHALDHRLYLGLTARNLGLAEKQGFNEILAPCAACYHRLASANVEFTNDPELLKSVNTEADVPYGGDTKVRNVLDYLANVVGTSRIAERVTAPLSGMKAVCYYGCLNTRVPRMKSFDDVEYPMSMDRVVHAVGAEALDWSYKTECCGASLFVTSEPTARRLVSRILHDAEVRGADCIVLACPMCHNNLDTKQAQIREEFNLSRPIPILFISQLIGLAFGIDQQKLKLDDGFVSMSSLGLKAS